MLIIASKSTLFLTGLALVAIGIGLSFVLRKFSERSIKYLGKTTKTNYRKEETKKKEDE